MSGKSKKVPSLDTTPRELLSSVVVALFKHMFDAKDVDGFETSMTDRSFPKSGTTMIAI